MKRHEPKPSEIYDKMVSMVFEHATIGDVIRHGVVFNPRNWGRFDVNENELVESIRELFDLLRERQISYVLVGGIAMLQYVEGRNTQDIDLIIAVPSLKKLPEVRIESRDENFGRGYFNDLQIDFLFTTNPVFKEVSTTHTTTLRFGDQQIETATTAGLILLKLYALPSLYRQGNFAKVGIYENDVATLMQAYEVNRSTIVTALSHHLDTPDMREIETILQEIEERIERFRQKSNHEK